MKRLRVAAPAKINWMLRVLRRRSDGYHDIETIFETISLHDEIDLEESAALSVSCDAADIPLDRVNLAWQAAEAMQRRFSCPPVAITIRKRIPAGGGLGGGSSNAAAVMRGMQDLFAVTANQRQLESIALEIGSDVPFFLSGGLAYATGRGEELTLLERRTEAIPLLLIMPDERMATAEAYSSLARMRSGGNASRASLGLDRARQIATDPYAISGELINDLEPAVFAQLGRLEQWKRILAAQTDAWWSGMTGSGSTVVAAYRSHEQRTRARDVMRQTGARIVEAETVQRQSAGALPPPGDGS